MWSHEIVGVSTGDRYQEIEFSASSWAVRMNDQVGTGTSTVQVTDPMFEAWSSEFWLDLTKPWSRVIVGKWDGAPVWAHVITGRKYNPLTGVLTLEHAEVGELLKKLLFFPTGDYSANARIDFTDYTRAGMLIAVARHMCGGGYWADQSPRRFPVHFDPAPSGGWNKFTLQHEFEHPWNWLADIANGDPGVDFVFSPGFGGDSGDDGLISGFQWVFHAGSPLNRSTHEYVVGAPYSPVLSAEVTWDAAEHATGVFALGEGQGAARPVGRYATAGTPEIPRVITLGQESNQSSLVSAAQGELTAVRTPPEVWSVQMRAESVLVAMHGGPNDGLRPGSWLVLHFDDPVLGQVTREFYVTGLGGDVSETVTVEAQLYETL